MCRSIAQVILRMLAIKLRHIAIIVPLSLVFSTVDFEGEPWGENCCFALADTSGVMSQTPDWDYDFELGWNSEYGQGGLANRNPAAPEWRYAQMQTDEAGMAVVDPLNPSNQSMRFLWQKGAGTEYDANTRKKAHLYGEFGANHSVEEIWAFDVLFPSVGMEYDAHSTIIAQWHGVPDSGEEFRRPPIAVDNRNDRLTLSWLYDSRQITPPGFEDWDVSSRDLGATAKDQWINFAFHIKYDPWGSGALRVFRDGQLVVDESDIAIGFNDQIGAYLGFGIYQWTGSSDHEQRSIYFDNMRQWIVWPSMSNLPGDANGDDSVDVVDLGILASHYGRQGDGWWGGGDFTGEGDVDVSDLGILATNYGTSLPALSVPEPSLAIMLVSIVVSALSVQRRRV